ncbi:MAG: ComF family protein [Chloroflexi bacterium]|nr:ComF family protein [Chloroflexota bacterium]
MLTHPLLQKSTQSLLDLLFPPRCISCKATHSWLCQDCFNRISFITTPICNRCGTPKTADAPACRQCKNNPLQYIDGIRSAASFEDNPIRPAIHFLKYRNHKAVVSVLATLLAETYQRYHLAVDVIVPVPLHASRLRERGYNQSELLARAMGDIFDVPVNSSTLQRTRHTRSQMTLGVNERHQNVAEAFACGNLDLAGQIILLLDDVCTTGSTLDACASALKKSGAVAVWGLTLAKAR